MRIVTRLLSPPPADVRAALRATAAEARALGLDNRAHMLAAAIVAATAYNPPHISAAVAAAIAERWGTIADGVRKTRPPAARRQTVRGAMPRVRLPPGVVPGAVPRKQLHWRSSVAHCEAGLRDIDQLRGRHQRRLSVIEACVRPRGHLPRAVAKIPLISARCDLVGLVLV